MPQKEEQGVLKRDLHPILGAGCTWERQQSKLKWCLVEIVEANLGSWETPWGRGEEDWGCWEVECGRNAANSEGSNKRGAERMV
jgi:hypothetical protein